MQTILTHNSLDNIHTSQSKFCKDLNTSGTTYTTHSKFKRDFKQQSVITFFFDENYIAVGNNPVKKYKTCNFLVPLKLPRGYQVSFYDAEYQGSVDSGTIGTLKANYFLTSGSLFGSGGGPSGTVFTQNFNGPIYYDVKHNLVTLNQVSACSQTVNLRVNTSMLATGVGIATVDSIDLAKRGLTYFWQLKPC